MKGKTVRKEKQISLCGNVVRTALLALAAAVASPALAEETNGWRVGAHGGTAGVGASAAWDFHDKLAVRAIANRFNYDRKETVSGKRYKGKLELANFGLLLDWHPFDNGFRVSGGAILNRNEINARATSETLRLGNMSLTGAAKLTRMLTFATLRRILALATTAGAARKGLVSLPKRARCFKARRG